MNEIEIQRTLRALERAERALEAVEEHFMLEHDDEESTEEVYLMLESALRDLRDLTGEDF